MGPRRSALALKMDISSELSREATRQGERRSCPQVKSPSGGGVCMICANREKQRALLVREEAAYITGLVSNFAYGFRLWFKHAKFNRGGPPGSSQVKSYFLVCIHI